MLPVLTPVGTGERLEAIRLHVTTGITTGRTGHPALTNWAKELRLIRVELTPCHLKIELYKRGQYLYQHYHSYLIDWEMQLAKGAKQKVTLTPQPPVNLSPGLELLMQTNHVVRKVPVVVPGVLTDQLAVAIQSHVLRDAVDIRADRAGHQLVTL